MGVLPSRTLFLKPTLWGSDRVLAHHIHVGRTADMHPLRALGESEFGQACS